MKPSDLKIQTTYVYDVPEGGKLMCRKETFARWAERESAPGEAAPRTA